jgi:hypothetical protein
VKGRLLRDRDQGLGIAWLGAWRFGEFRTRRYVLVTQLYLTPSRKVHPILKSMPRSYQSLLWTQLANEARVVAKQIKVKELKLHVVLMAVRYLVWAKRAEKETSTPTPQQHTDPYE